MNGATTPSAPAVRRTGRQRRPTGAPPPLPRRITPSTTVWLVLAAIIVTGAFGVSERTPWLRADDQASTWLLRQLASVRTPWLTGVANWINTTGVTWHPLIAVVVVLGIVLFRRWRHLLVFTLCLFFLEIAGAWIYDSLSRPRPYGVAIIGRWDGYSAPGSRLAALTFLLMGAVYCLVAPGRPRSVAKAGVAVVVALFCLSRLYLAVDHPDDDLFGVVLAVAVPVTAFRFFTPNEVFPVVYRRGRTAHVDVTGRRGVHPARSSRPARRVPEAGAAAATDSAAALGGPAGDRHGGDACRGRGGRRRRRQCLPPGGRHRRGRPGLRHRALDGPVRAGGAVLGAAASPTSSASSPERPPCWPSRWTPRSRSSREPSWPTTSGGPRTWRSAGGAPRAREIRSPVRGSPDARRAAGRHCRYRGQRRVFGDGARNRETR